MCPDMRIASISLLYIHKEQSEEKAERGVDERFIRVSGKGGGGFLGAGAWEGKEKHYLLSESMIS